jgi:hypothetical protein
VRGHGAIFDLLRVRAEIVVTIVQSDSTTIQHQMQDPSRNQIMDPRHDHNVFQMPQMAAPPLMNPPPQIFGAYVPDGMPNMNLKDLNQPIFGDASLMDESLEAKRRRIARV